MRPRRLLAIATLAAALVLLPVTATATQAEGAPRCAASRHPGGDWPGLNHDLSNSRSQAAESVLGVAQAASMAPVWSFSGASVGALGGMRSTPVVADGCVYLGLGEGYLGERGDVIALNADTGELVWHQQLDGSVLGLTVSEHRIYAAVSKGVKGSSPFVNDEYVATSTSLVAFDSLSGTTRWTSPRLDDGNSNNGTFINATPVAFRAGGRSLIFTALSGGGGDGARVPMYFLDAVTGKVVRKSYSLTELEYAQGHGGTGIWSTAAFDPGTQYLYAGTADSDSHTHQHPYNNAILKIDANPLRPAFGKVVAAYSGITEHANLDALIGYPNNPLCGLTGDWLTIDPPTFFDTSASTECLELDLDFGASPNLYRGTDGRLMVGALQKAGVYHSVSTTSMRADWRFFVGTAGAVFDGGTSAVVGDRIHVPASPNLLFTLDRDTGSLKGLTTTEVQVFSYGPVTEANGVLYAINDVGVLIAYDAKTGLVLSRQLIATAGQSGLCLGTGSGVAVARNTVYAPCNGGATFDIAGLPGQPGGLVAYR